MKRLFTRRRELLDHYTALDIGTEYIKALVIRREGESGIVLGVGRQKQSYSDMVSGAVADIQAVIDNCSHSQAGAFSTSPAQKTRSRALRTWPM